MVDIDLKHKDRGIGLPDPVKVSESDKDVVSPILVGRMYEIRKFKDDKGEDYAEKKLRAEIANSEYYPKQTLEEIFLEHVAEHQTYVEYLGDFVEPSEFYIEVEEDGTTHYCMVHAWIDDGVQFKEAIKNGTKLPETQLPKLEDRLKYVSGLAGLMDKLDLKLPDLDFFVSREEVGTRIRIFDTTGFWYEKNGGKDRNRIALRVEEFLFTKEEREKPEIREVLNKLHSSAIVY